MACEDISRPLTLPIQIVATIIFASTLGISELFDHNSQSTTQARAFDTARRERFYSSLSLVVGIIASVALVLWLAIYDISGLTDEKMWFWLGLVYILVRRRKSNRQIDRICKKFTEFAVQIPVCYYFGFPEIDKEELRNRVSLHKLFLSTKSSDEGASFRWSFDYRCEVHDGEASRPIYVEEKSSSWLSMFANMEKVTIKIGLGGFPRNLGPYLLYSVTKKSAQHRGNAIWLPEGSQARDQYLLSVETVIEQKRKDGREHVAIAAAWYFLTLIFHPMRFASEIPVMKALLTPSNTFYEVRNTFLPGWRKLQHLARLYLLQVIGCELKQTTAMVILVAALANNIIQDNYSWLESMLPVIRDFWNEHIGLLLESSWSIEHPSEIVKRPSKSHLERLIQVGYAGDLQKELMRRLWRLWGDQDDFRGKVDEETEALLASLVGTSFRSS